MNARRELKARQDGAVLAISLILLLIMTLLAVTAMRGSLLEEKMAGNSQDSGVAMQAAEAALRDGELFLQQNSLPSFNGSGGLYAAADPAAPPLWTTIDWSDSAQVRSYGGFAGAPGSLQRASAGYFIEEMPLVSGVGESLAADAPVDELRFYRITARGVGVGGNAVALLQTTFRR